jgi:hypothetical protein
MNHPGGGERILHKNKSNNFNQKEEDILSSIENSMVN